MQECEKKNETPTRPPQKTLVHDVVCGETLSSISLLYGVSVDAIVTYNEIFNVNQIYAGSALLIPGVSEEFSSAGDITNNMSEVE